MLSFVIGVIVSAIALAVTTTVLPSITYGGETQTLIIVALIFGVVNALIGPIVRLLSLPLRMMTFGLFGLVINGGLLLLTAWISESAGFTFQIDTFPPDLSLAAIGAAIVATIVMSIVTTILNLVLPGR